MKEYLSFSFVKGAYPGRYYDEASDEFTVYLTLTFKVLKIYGIHLIR